MHAPFRIATTGGRFTAYVARPQKLPAPAIVVIHEVFGVNADMRQTCDELAAQGYLANGRTADFLALHLQPH
jgi:carboxymethylenebutenolidase